MHKLATPRTDIGLSYTVHIYTVRQKKEPVFFCVHLFIAGHKLVNFFHIHKGKYKLQFRTFNFGMR